MRVKNSSCADCFYPFLLESLDLNVKDYIARRKLAQAKALLTGTDLPVREVAARLGYAGEIGIIRLFRKYEGTTPGDYRAQHK